MTVTLSGTMTCPPDERETVRAALATHIRLTRAEPGCEMFEVIETEPGTFSVSERFADMTAFEAHQRRTRASDWWRITGHLSRDFQIRS